MYYRICSLLSKVQEIIKLCSHYDDVVNSQIGVVQIRSISMKYINIYNFNYFGPSTGVRELPVSLALACQFDFNPSMDK